MIDTARTQGALGAVAGATMTLAADGSLGTTLVATFVGVMAALSVRRIRHDRIAALARGPQPEPEPAIGPLDRCEHSDVRAESIEVEGLDGTPEIIGWLCAECGDGVSPLAAMRRNRPEVSR